MRKYDTVLLFGGGMDSMAYAIWVAQQKRVIHLLHVDYGQKAAPGEIEAMMAVCETYKCLKPHKIKAPIIALNSESSLLKGKKGDDYFMESRNLGLALIASKFTTSIEFCFSLDASIQEYPDTSRAWCETASRLLSMGSKKRILVSSPVIELDREDSVLEAMNINPELMLKAYTCYEYPACGKCYRCKWKKTIEKAYRMSLKGR